MGTAPGSVVIARKWLTTPKIAIMSKATKCPKSQLERDGGSTPVCIANIAYAIKQYVITAHASPQHCVLIRTVGLRCLVVVPCVGAWSE